MSLNTTQSLQGKINSTSTLSGDVTIGTTFISAGGGAGNPIVISTEKIEGGYRISLTDSIDTEVIDIMDGKDGAPGPQGIPGEKGEDGNSGVYVGPGEAPEECNVQIDPDGGVTNLIEAPTTAEVGQMLVVKAVDENGVPTEWEVSDVASGGSGGASTYKYEVTTTEEVETIEIDVNSYDNSEFFIRVLTGDDTTFKLRIQFIIPTQNDGYYRAWQTQSGITQDILQLRTYLKDIKNRKEAILFARKQTGIQQIVGAYWNNLHDTPKIIIKAEVADTKFPIGTVVQIHEVNY